MAAMMKQAPHAVVKFKVYSRKMDLAYPQKMDMVNDDRRLNRVETKNAIPFGPWARMIGESIFSFDHRVSSASHFFVFNFGLNLLVGSQSRKKEFLNCLTLRLCYPVFYVDHHRFELCYSWNSSW